MFKEALLNIELLGIYFFINHTIQPHVGFITILFILLRLYKKNICTYNHRNRVQVCPLIGWKNENSEFKLKIKHNQLGFMNNSK